MKKVPVEGSGVRPTLASPEERAEFFSSPEDFTTPSSSPTVVGGCQIEELEAAVDGSVATIRPAGIVSLDCPRHLTANVGELLDQR